MDTLAIYLRDAARFSPFTAAEERDLHRRMHQGDESARDALICVMLRYVVTLCRPYSKDKVDFESLVQEGNLGLFEAVAKFDPDKGRWTTCAHWWIFRAIHRGRRRSQLSGKSIDYMDELAEEFDGQDELANGEDLRIKLDAMRRALATLGARHRFILESRMAGVPLRQLSATLGICKERVRQLETRALELVTQSVRRGRNSALLAEAG